MADLFPNNSRAAAPAAGTWGEYLDRGERGAVVWIGASDRPCWIPPFGAKSRRGYAGARFLEQPVDGTPLREEGIDDIQSTFIGGHILPAVRRDAAVMVEVEFILGTIAANIEGLTCFGWDLSDLPLEREEFIVDPAPAWDRQGLIFPVKLNPASVVQLLEEIG